MHRLALIVPTRNRPKLLGQLLESLAAGSVRPHQTIVVDGSDEPIEATLAAHSLPVTYVRVWPPGLTRQRNAGLLALDDGIDLVGYLDDDILVAPDAIENLLRFWQGAGPDVGGVLFHITNTPHRPPSLLYRLFLVESRRRGTILRSGYATSVEPTEAATPSAWLCGGATVWRREIVDRFAYDEWFAGAANYEDADFAYRAGREYRLFVLRDARVEHHPPPFDPKKMRHYGEMHVTYRWYFVKKHFGRTFPAFYWATAGVIASHLVSALIRWNRASFYGAVGGLIGLVKVLVGCAQGIHKEFRREERHSSRYVE